MTHGMPVGDDASPEAVQDDRCTMGGVGSVYLCGALRSDT